MLHLVKRGDTHKVRVKSSDKSVEEGATLAVEKARKAKANAKTDDEKVSKGKRKERKKKRKKKGRKEGVFFIMSGK